MMLNGDQLDEMQERVFKESGLDRSDEDAFWLARVAVVAAHQGAEWSVQKVISTLFDLHGVHIPRHQWQAHWKDRWKSLLEAAERLAQ